MLSARQPLNRPARTVATALLALGTLAAPIAAQAAAPDTVPAARRDSATLTVMSRETALLGLGFAVGVAAVRPADRYFTQRLQQPALQENGILRNTAAVFRLLAVPGGEILGAGFYVAGRLRRDETMTDVALHGSEALVLTQVLVFSIKGLAGRARPYVDTSNPSNFGLARGFQGDRYQSFPSGHAAAAFSIASALTAETGFWRPKARKLVGIPLYTAATLAGISRVYNNKHWSSDVFAGAGIATLMGITTIRLNHARPENAVDRLLAPRIRVESVAGAPPAPVLVFALPAR